MAALRAGNKTVVIPSDNEKDLAEIPDNVKRGLRIIPAATVEEVLRLALAGPLTPIEWIEPPEPSTPVGEKSGDEDVGIVTH